jgi:hypothetical protein
MRYLVVTLSNLAISQLAVSLLNWRYVQTVKVGWKLVVSVACNSCGVTITGNILPRHYSKHRGANYFCVLSVEMLRSDTCYSWLIIGRIWVQKILAQRPATLTEIWEFSLFPYWKFWGSNKTEPRLCPSMSFPVHHSPIILLFDAR